MSVLVYGINLIFLAFFIHFLVWKIYLPKHQTKVLIYIFFITLISGVAILKFLPIKLTLFHIFPPQSLYEYLQLSFLFISLTLAYIASYSAIEADSPSLIIIKEIAEAGSRGLDRSILEQKIDKNILIIPRIKDLVTAGMVYLEEGKYKLKPKGIILAYIFTVYRKILKRQKGG